MRFGIHAVFKKAIRAIAQNKLHILIGTFQKRHEFS